jgi:hypothetical protein
MEYSIERLDRSITGIIAQYQFVDLQKVISPMILRMSRKASLP